MIAQSSRVDSAKDLNEALDAFIAILSRVRGPARSYKQRKMRASITAGARRQMDKELDFTGKTVLVTGSGRNIGRAIILEFAARGANVIINSRTNEAEARGVEQEA